MNLLDTEVQETAIYDHIAEGVPEQCRGCQVVGSLIMLTMEIHKPDMLNAKQHQKHFLAICDPECPGPDSEESQYPRMCKFPQGTGKLIADYGTPVDTIGELQREIPKDSRDCNTSTQKCRHKAKESLVMQEMIVSRLEQPQNRAEGL